MATDWRERGACLSVDPDLFFPIGTTGPAALQLIQAKQMCHGCEVQDICLQWAMDTGVDHGVWGGLSEDERRVLRRRTARHRLASR